MVKRVVVGAHYGLRDWLMQRITAVIMAVSTVLFLIAFAIDAPAGYTGWKSFLSHSWIRIGILLFLISLYLHAWVGIRDILMDYVHPTGIRLTLQVLAIVSLAIYLIWSVEILWGN
ncbi:MAG: succinate dehydrogenase, hydrophobic membrane anchor protein [Burkholderiales bacterium]|nr:succinate dehydrogenase, hydrophobic membrane anchor protein [Burkholderiales bacterium]